MTIFGKSFIPLTKSGGEGGGNYMNLGITRLE